MADWRTWAAEREGWPVPDDREGYKYHATCRTCGEKFTFTLDLSCGEITSCCASCPRCGAYYEYEVACWIETQVGKVQAYEPGNPPQRRDSRGRFAAA